MGINLHKGICASRPASVQLLIFLLLVSAGAIFSSLLSTVYILLTQGLETDMTQNPNLVRVIQLIASIGTFLLPALGMAWLCSASPKQYLSIRGIKDPRTWILTFVCMLLLTPVINLLGLLNQQFGGTTNHDSLVGQSRRGDYSQPHRNRSRRGHHRGVPVPGRVATGHREIHNKPAHGHLDRRGPIQRFPPAILRLPAPYAARRLFRLPAVLGEKHLAPRVRAFHQQRRSRDRHVG